MAVSFVQIWTYWSGSARSQWRGPMRRTEIGSSREKRNPAGTVPAGLVRGAIRLRLVRQNRAFPGTSDQTRSEEHTSELQSLMRISSAVFCLKQKNQLLLNKSHTIQKTTKHLR